MRSVVPLQQALTWHLGGVGTGRCMVRCGGRYGKRPVCPGTTTRGLLTQIRTLAGGPSARMALRTVRGCNSSIQSASRPVSAAMSLYTLGLSHATAPLDVREKVTFAPERVPDALRELIGPRKVREA